MTSTPPDDEPLRRCMRDNYEAVYRYALRRCRDEDIALEVAAETFMVLIRNPGKLKSIRNQIVWLICVARNKLRHIEERRWGRRRAEALFSEIYPTGLPEDSLRPLFAASSHDSTASIDDVLAAQRLWVAILRLPADQREAMLLKYAENFTSDEIAQVMKRSKRTVDRLIERGRKGVSSAESDPARPVLINDK